MGSLFGQKLRYLRRRQHLTQVVLARYVALASHAHVSNMEASRSTPSLDVIVTVANRFAVQVAYLVREDLPVQAADEVQYQRAAGARSLQVQALGPNLTRLRMQSGLTQAHLAEHLGLAANAHVSYMETGRKFPSVELLLRVADRFGVTVDDLLTASG